MYQILSPGNQAKTRRATWAYATIPSVREILAVHSTCLEVELLRRDAGGNWPESPLVVRPPDMLGLTSIGFVTAVAAL